jgi:phosphoribosyl-ATP pyrophosphohydrolase/phosphoribosyl-AMP cyclohydrolase
MFAIDEVVFDQSGLVPVVVQDAKSHKVLMLGYMNRVTLQETLELQQIVFWSRSRNRRWLKGETSGNFLNLIELSRDCDSDALLALVEPVGPTCHTGSKSCFEASHD